MRLLIQLLSILAVLAFASGQVSPADQQSIINTHNDLRRQVAKGRETQGKPGPQPPASNMRQLVWDADLARAAQVLTDRCNFGHDTSIPAGPWSGYGQNLAAGGYGSWENAVKAWYNEVANFDNSGVGKYVFDPNTGHYTQVVWANTYAVGCGFTVCSTGWSPIYACNYGPPGNYINQPIYTIGSAATACPSGTSPNDGLCA